MPVIGYKENKDKENKICNIETCATYKSYCTSKNINGLLAVICIRTVQTRCFTCTLVVDVVIKSHSGNTIPL